MNSKKEIKIKSDKIFEGKILTLYKDEVQCPNGNFSYREIVSHCGATCIVAVHNDKIIMEKQYRYPFDEELIEIPAGKLEPNEDFIECARRELEEETGYYANRITFLGLFYPTVAYSNEKIYMYVAEDLVKTKTNWDADENLEIYEDTIEHLMEQIKDGTIKDGKTIAALSKYYLFRK